MSVLAPGLIVFWLTLGAFWTRRVEASPPAATPDRAEAAEAVVEALLSRLSMRLEGDLPRSRVTARPIVWPEEAGVACDGIPDLERATVEDFLRQNETTTAILPVYVVRMPVDGVERFGRARDALALVAVSPAGFNAAVTEAVVYVDHLMGPHQGRGFLYRLIRTSAGWRVREVLHVWAAGTPSPS